MQSKILFIILMLLLPVGMATADTLTFEHPRDTLTYNYDSFNMTVDLSVTGINFGLSCDEITQAFVFDMFGTDNTPFGTDVNDDGWIGQPDVDAVALHYSETGDPFWIPEDVDGSGDVGASDISYLALTQDMESGAERIDVYVNTSVSDVFGASSDTTIAYRTQTLTVNGTYLFEFDKETFAFDKKEYTVYSEMIAGNGNITASDTVGFNFSGEASQEFHFSVGNCDPPHLDLYASRAIHGATFEITGNLSDSFIGVITDDSIARNIIAVGFPSVAPDITGDNLTWQFKSLNTNAFEVMQGYYIYVGILTTGTEYTTTNTVVTSIDDTCYNVVFSMDDYKRGTDVKESTSEDLDYVGVGWYFETFIPLNDDGSTWTPPNQDNSFGDMVRSWANDADAWGGEDHTLPWFPVALGIIFVIIAMLIPLGFAIKFNVTIPSLVYGVAMTVGVCLATIVELFAWWMLIAYCVIIALTLVTKYKDNMVEAWETVQGRPLQTALGYAEVSKSSLATGIVREASGIGKLLKRKKKGVSVKGDIFVPEGKRISRAGKPKAGRYSPRSKEVSRTTSRAGKPTGSTYAPDMFSTKQKKKIMRGNGSSKLVRVRGMTKAERDNLHPEKIKKEREARSQSNYYKNIREFAKKKQKVKGGKR